MGGKQSCPSDALDNVWVADKDAPQCFNCGTGFTMRRRRHHCRCCGGVFCVACWGDQVQLEEAYGFPGPVPICSICGEVYKKDGCMYMLRKGITVAQTHESRSNVTHDSQIPPLANANIRARKFHTNLLTLGHWRPFTKHTRIQLTKTKSSKHVLRAAKSAGLTPRGESTLSGRDSASGSNALRDSIVVGGSNDDAWTLELDAVESIQLLSFDEKEGGEFICITTNMDEHRIQAVKVRFEEVAVMLPSASNNNSLKASKDEASNNNNNNSSSNLYNNEYAGEDPTPNSNNNSARAVPIPMSARSNNNSNADEYSAVSMGRGSVIRNGRLADGKSLGPSSFMSNNAASGMMYSASSYNNTNNNMTNNNSSSSNNNNNNNNDGNDDDTNDDSSSVAGSGTGTGVGRGGEKCSASDRRSNVSANATNRLRTVMLDKEATRNLYNALLRAHYVCRKRSEYVPASVKTAVEVDFAEDEVHIGPGAGSVTPRVTPTRQSSPAGFGYSSQSHFALTDGNGNNNSDGAVANNGGGGKPISSAPNHGASTARNPRSRAYTMG